MEFEWDNNKDLLNQKKHGVSFYEAQFAFIDSKRIIALDKKHSNDNELRYFCFGKVKNQILTVRFTVRNEKIRIFGAGYWREGKEKYEKENKL